MYYNICPEIFSVTDKKNTIEFSSSEITYCPITKQITWPNFQKEFSTISQRWVSCEVTEQAPAKHQQVIAYVEYNKLWGKGNVYVKNNYISLNIVSPSLSTLTPNISNYKFYWLRWFILSTALTQYIDCILNLKVHKSIGPDKMHPKVLREMADEVAKLVFTIFEKSWQTGEFPTDWKRWNISPLLKRGRKKTWGTTDQSVSSLWLARSWSRPSWKLS